MEAGDPPPSAAASHPPRNPNSRKRNRSSAADDDLISTLPDAIICHVLSFLDVEDVIKTSALSKRWYSVWTQTTAVSLDCHRQMVEDFSFLDRFLLQCTSPVIEKLHLSLNYFVEMKENIDLWFRFAIGRDIKDLCIKLHNNRGDENYVLPRALLRCESLKSLQLESCDFPSLSGGNFGMITWSSLKVLRIYGVKMVDEVVNGVLEGSPLLESLTLEECYGMKRIRIFSRKMRELVICGYWALDDEHSDDEDVGHGYSNYWLEIYAPYLRSLRLLSQWEGKDVIVLKEVSSLVEVELNFYLVLYKTNVDIICGSMKGILSKLCFVDKFVIGSDILMDLQNYKGKGDFSLQLKCRHLTIVTLADIWSLGRVAEILECAPNVEKLVIDFAPKVLPAEIPLNEDISFNVENFGGKLQKCLTDHLTNIEIMGFPAGNGAEPKYWLSLIKVLLRDALVLEKMVINAKWSWKSDGSCLEQAHVWDLLEVVEDILGYPRGSKAAKVIVNYPFKRRQSFAGST